MSYNDIIKSEELIIIIVILIMSLVGSLSKDYINLIKKGIKMKIGRIVMSTISSSIITYTFSMYILDKLQFRGLVGFSFFIGLLGFELVSKLSNLSEVIKLYLLAKFGLNPDKLETIKDIGDKLDKIDERLEADEHIIKQMTNKNSNTINNNKRSNRKRG